MNVGYAVSSSFMQLVYFLTELYIWALVANAVMSWMISFEVINARSPFVQKLGEFLYRLTEPALKHVRKAIPPIAGVDMSPFALILLIWFVRSILLRILVLG
jgi:YggT family protein